MFALAAVVIIGAGAIGLTQMVGAHAATPGVICGNSCGGGGGGGLPACTWVPNAYAGGFNSTLNHYGVRGSIQSTTFTIPSQNQDFSDSAFHVFTSAGGIEVGWFIGYSFEYNQYFTPSPHAYATLNGPHELDGPAVGNATDFYSTYLSGSTQIINVRTSNGGTLIWSNSQPAGWSGPGNVIAAGEVNDNSLHMYGYFVGVNPALQYFSGTGAWDSWPSLSLCADQNYGASGNVNSILVGGN